MCGIAGMISLRQGRNADWESTDRMLARIKHRGPDDSGVCAIMSDGRLLPARSAADLKKSCGGGANEGCSGIQQVKHTGHFRSRAPADDFRGRAGCADVQW